MKPMPIYLYQGDDWACLITVNNCDGTPFDLTGYTPLAEIRQGPADQCWHPSATFTTAILPATAPAVPNQISMSLTSEQTTYLRNPNYVWDLEITSSAGIVTTIAMGSVAVTPQVSRVWPPPWGTAPPPSARRAATRRA